MTITREIFDNDKEIVHINYSDEDIENAIKKAEDRQHKHEFEIKE